MNNLITATATAPILINSTEIKEHVLVGSGRKRCLCVCMTLEFGAFRRNLLYGVQEFKKVTWEGNEQAYNKNQKYQSSLANHPNSTSK